MRAPRGEGSWGWYILNWGGGHGGSSVKVHEDLEAAHPRSWGHGAMKVLYIDRHIAGCRPNLSLIAALC